MPFDWSGNVLGAAEMLDVLGMTRRTGTFQVVRESDAYGFSVHAGHVIYATSTHRTLRLGHLLLQRGAVEPMYLHDVLRGRRTVSRDRALGTVLVRDGAVSPEDLAAGVEEQAIEVLARVVALSGATFLYHGDDSLPLGIEIVPMETERLMTEAIKRHFERESIKVMQRLTPPPDCPLHLTVQLALVSYQLTDAELLVAIHVDRASTTMDRLGAMLPLDPLTLKRTLISLIERGYVARGELDLRFGP